MRIERLLRLPRRLWTDARFAWEIGRRGWTVAAARGSEPPFTMSVGFLEAAAAPEVAVSGLPHDMAAEMIEGAYQMLRAGELVLADGTEWPWTPGIDAGPLWRWRAVHQSHFAGGLLAPAVRRWVGRGQPLGRFRAFQLVAADRKGRFPWEADHDPAEALAQDALYAPADGPTSPRARP